MNRFKKAISIIFVLLLVFSLMSGCGYDKSVKGHSKSAGSKAEEISEDAALEIALKDAGFKKSDVKHIKVELDYDDDDDRYEYEVEFKNGKYEYEYNIEPYTGDILEKDKDIDN